MFPLVPLPLWSALAAASGIGRRTLDSLFHGRVEPSLWVANPLSWQAAFRELSPPSEQDLEAYEPSDLRPQGPTPAWELLCPGSSQPCPLHLFLHRPPHVFGG